MNDPVTISKENMTIILLNWIEFDGPACGKSFHLSLDWPEIVQHAGAIFYCHYLGQTVTSPKALLRTIARNLAFRELKRRARFKPLTNIESLLERRPTESEHVQRASDMQALSAKIIERCPRGVRQVLKELVITGDYTDAAHRLLAAQNNHCPTEKDIARMKKHIQTNVQRSRRYAEPFRDDAA